MSTGRSLTAVEGEIAKYSFNLVGIQEVIWELGGAEPAGDYTFFYEKGQENHELGTGVICVRKSDQHLRR